MEHSFSRLFVPKTIHSHGGTLVLGTNGPYGHSFTGPFFPSFSVVPGLAVPKSPIMGTVISTSVRCSTSGVTSISGRDSISAIAAELRSPRTCDLRTIWQRSFLRD